MRKSLAAGIGLVVGSVIVLSIVASCGKDVTGPTTSPTVVSTQDPTIPAPNQPVGQPAIVNSPAAYDVSWSERASWQVGNRSADTLYYKAQYTDFDNQALVRGSQDLVAAPGTISHGTFDRGCVQVDLLTGGAIFAAAYFGKDGRQFNPSSAPGKVAECRITPSPDPSPSPTPRPSPSPSPTPSPSPDPDPACYYRVSCGAQQSNGGGNCPDQSQQTICEAAVSVPGEVHGAWLNFAVGALHNHCQFPLPGVSSDNFQLNPGQSNSHCLDKRDD